MNTVPFILGLAGRKGAGKSTFAEGIEQWYAEQDREDEVITYRFTDPLKACFTAMFDQDYEKLSREQREASVALGQHGSVVTEVFSFSPRDFCLAVGDALRERDPAVLVKLMRHDIERTSNDVKLIVIPDVRLQQELQLVKDMGGEVWWIDRYIALGGHITERDISRKDCDHETLNAYGSVEEWQRYARHSARYIAIGTAVSCRQEL